MADHKWAQDMLLERERLLKAVEDSLSANIAVLNSGGVIIEVNESWNRFARENGDPTLAHTGVGINYLDVCRRATGSRSEGAAETLAGLEAILAGSTAEFEIEYPCPSDKEERWFFARATALRSQNGGLVIAHHNITDRVLAENAIRQSENRYRSLIETMNEGFATGDQNYVFTYVNARFAEMLGYEPDEMIGHSMEDFLDKADLAVARQQGTERKAGRSDRYELAWRAKDGRKVYTLISPRPIFGEDGRFAGSFATLTDITERKQSEEALARRGRQLETLARTSRRLNTVLDIPTIMRELVASAIELCDAEDCVGGLVTDGKILFTEYNRKGKLIPIHYEFNEDCGTAGWVAQTLKPYVSNDAEHDPRVAPEMREALGFYNLANVPIISRSGELLGCFETHNTRDRRPFDEDDISMLQGLAANAAVALENARMLLDREHAEEERRTFEKHVDDQKRAFYRETIFSVTGGKLDVCEESEVIPYLAGCDLAMEVSEGSQVSPARHKIEDYCRDQGLKGERLSSFIVGVGEAITNAVKHAARGRVCAGVKDGHLWVGVEDEGPGIESLILPRAVLLRGFSTKPSLGLGYSVMLEVADRLHLKTDERGTLVILEKRLEESVQELSLHGLPDPWDTIPG